MTSNGEHVRDIQQLFTADKSNTNCSFDKPAEEIVYRIGKVTYLQPAKGNTFHVRSCFLVELCHKLTLKPRL